MTNDPSSGQPGGGGMPPRDRPEGTSSEPGMGSSGAGDSGMSSGGSMPPSGGYTPPPAGGYTPPPTGGFGQSESAGEPTRDISGEAGSMGGYTPPPHEGGTPTEDISVRYAPSDTGGGMASDQGGYTPPPPAGGGGYTPPPGGYAPPPPPPAGGYGAPPPPGGGGAGAMDFGHLPQSYINAVTKPSAATYEAEIPNAGIVKVLLGVLAVAIVSAIMGLLAAGAADATFDQLSSQLGGQVDPGTIQALRGSSNPLWAFIRAFILPFITFFLGAGMLWLLSKMLGGQNSDFVTHSYLLSLSYVPTRIAAAILNIIPCIGQVVGIVLFLYQIYLAGLAMQASQRMQPGRAQMAAWLGVLIGLVLLCICVVGFAGLLATLLGAAAADPNLNP